MFDANSLRASLSWGPRPFTLATLASRFAPAVVDPSELRERALARVRVVTPAGLKVGLVRRVFAREPLLPSDVEAEEEQQSRQQPGAPPERVKIEDLRALVVPVRASASTAPEMSPEEGPAPYPSMGEVSSAMWCEYDEESDRDSGGDSGDYGRRTATVSGKNSRGASKIFRRRQHLHRRPNRLLRFSVQSLEGHVCDDEDEDSDTDDGESETDREDRSDGGEGEDERVTSGRSLRWERRGRSNGPSRGPREGQRGAGSRRKRLSGARTSNKREQEEGQEEFDEVDCQRKEELASVLRRLRVAIRRMDGALTEEKVRCMAKHVVRVAALTASTSELVTTTAAMGAIRGLGDRIRLQRQRTRTGGSSRDVQWVTVHVGVGRWGSNLFGPGFAVETQDKYRLGWLSLSSQSASGPTEGDGTAGNTPASSGQRATTAGGARRGGWAGCPGFLFGLGRRSEGQQQEGGEEGGVDGWVGSLTCNFCEGHALGDTSACQNVGKVAESRGSEDYGGTQRFATQIDNTPEEEEEEQKQETFFQARDTVVTPSDEADEADGAVEAAERVDNDGQRASSPPVSGGPSARSPRLGKSETGAGEEEWCSGHVCLRLRPDGLREGRSRDGGVGGGTEGEPGGQNAGDGSEESDDGSGSVSDGEGLEDLDGIGGEGAPSSSNSSSGRRTPSIGEGSRGAGRKSGGVPLSSITTGFCEGERRERTASGDPSGVSSEKSSKSLEAFAWGDNTGGCLGLPLDNSAGLLPRPVEPNGLLPGERVVAVSCSERHSVLVTGMGSVYSAGDGTDGALGLGVRESSDSFRLVEWFAEQMSPPKACQASAGSDLVGCHSAVLDADGRLYTWGVGAAAGHASLKPVLLPREVETLGGFGTGIGARGADGRPAGLRSRVKGVACGGGFTLAVTHGGEVFAWGSWARGRLGLGRPPERRTGRRKKVPRFQATPRRVSGFGKTPIVQVAAGAWHGMALSEDGAVYTWGHNASGQLGFLVPPSLYNQRRIPQPATPYTPATASTVGLSEMLRASWTPVKLPCFGNASDSPADSLRAPMAGVGLPGLRGQEESNNSRLRCNVVHIACGSEHSIAVDSRGVAWTWGAEGRACLGHGEAGFGAPGGVTAVEAEAQARAMGLTGDGGGGSGGCRAGDGSGSGADPGGGVGATIVAAAGGFSHTVLVTSDGRMYLFGEGAAVVGGDLAAQEGNGGGVNGGRLREAGGLVRRHRSGEEEAGERVDPVTALSAVGGPTPVPREACSSWFPTMAARRVAAVACGGQHVIALLAGEHIGYTLGINLFRAAMGTQRYLSGDAVAERGGAHDAAGGAEVAGTAARWVKGGVDCELLVAGSYLHAHRVVLAARSPVLRDMIAQEERPGNNDDADGGAPPLQLLLPDIRFDVARALLEFLYTGELRRSLDLDSPLPYDLRAAAKSYGVPRLEALCTEAISLGADPRAVGEDGGQGGEWGQAAPPPSLAGDLGGALGSMEHADVKFVAGGRPIYAHRAVLSCECEYFDAMFRFRDQMGSGKKEQGGHATDMAEIVVPDSYSGFARLLLYLYTGVLPESSPESVLEDLVSADRYRLLGMKRVCQSMLRLSAGNCLQALHAAEMVSAPLLRQAALFHAEHNLSQVSQQEGFRDVFSGMPGLAEVLLSRLHATVANASAVSSAAARQKRLHDRSRSRIAGGTSATAGGAGGGDEDPSFRSDSPFPWAAALVAVSCGAVYYKVSNVVAVGMFVPVVNGMFMVCLAVFGFQKLKEKGVFAGGRGRTGRQRQRYRQQHRAAGGGASQITHDNTALHLDFFGFASADSINYLGGPRIRLLFYLSFRSRMDSNQHALGLSDTDVQGLRAEGTRQMDEIARIQGVNVAPQGSPASKLPTTKAELVWARDNTLRGLEDFKRDLGETSTGALPYRKQTEAATAGAGGGADLLMRENIALKTKLADLQRKHASLRREAETVVTEERRESATNLREQLSRLQGPAGFDVLKKENLALQERLACLQRQHGNLRRQAQAAINAAEERARASEAGRAAAYELGRRLEAQLSTVMDQASKLHQAVAVAPPAATVEIHGGAAVAPSAPIRRPPPPPPPPQQQQQQVFVMTPSLFLVSVMWGIVALRAYG
eukprot:g5820.t1